MTLARQEDLPSHQFIARMTDGSELILQRINDGYINATALCKACGKLFADYRRNSQTKAFLEALEASMGIPIDELIQTLMAVPNDQRGTWVHPHVAIHLAQWASPTFAVQVSTWVYEWMRGELVERPKPSDNPFHLIIRQAEAALDLQAQQLILANQQAATSKTVLRLSERIEALEDKAEHAFGGPECYTVKGYARRQGKNLPTSTLQKLGKEASQMCREQHRTIGEVPDEAFGVINTYPEEILSIVFFNNNFLRDSDAEA